MTKTKKLIGINLIQLKKALKSPTLLQKKKMKKAKSLADVAKIFPFKLE